MICRRTFFSFLVGAVALVGLPAAVFGRQMSICDMAWAFRDCKLRGGKLVFKFARYEGEEPTVGWSAWINGEKYGQFIALKEIPTEKDAIYLTEIMQSSMDRSRRAIASRLA